jgi:hypothetical protein
LPSNRNERDKVMPIIDQLFWQDFISGALATIVGIAIGIPVAFWINSQQEKFKRKEKVKKLIFPLSEELVNNSILLDLYLEQPGQRIDIINLYVKLRDETWRVFVDGGELQWINSPIILYKLASAYSATDAVKNLIKILLDTNLSSNENLNKSPTGRIHGTLIGSINYAVYKHKILFDEINKHKREFNFEIKNYDTLIDNNQTRKNSTNNYIT